MVRGKNVKRLGEIIGCKYKTSSWHLNGFPDGSNIGSTVHTCFFLFSFIKKNNLNKSRQTF